MRSQLLPAVGVLLSLLATAAHSTTLYQQPTVWAGNGTSVGSSWTSQADPSNSGFRTFDNFSLAAGGTINAVVWWGIYVDGNNNNAAFNTDSWAIRISADSAGLPGGTLAQETLLAAQVDTQIVGTGVFGNPVTVYRFTAFFPTFTAAPGTPYWFSTRSNGPTFLPAFSWIQGTGGNGNSVQTAFTNGVVTDEFIRDGDRAFALLQVPEPATMLLIGVGFVGLALCGRRRLHDAQPRA